MSMPIAIVHEGRAANCMCKEWPGKRCPDCNHLLTGEMQDFQFGELSLQHSEVKCTVCGRVISDEKKSDQIILQVQNASQKTSAKIKSK